MSMVRRVDVAFDELRIGDTVQYHEKRGVSAGKVTFITFKETGKVESFRVDTDPSNYYKLAFIRGWTIVTFSGSSEPRFNNVELVEVKVDNAGFEKEMKKKQILGMLEACQESGIELRSTGMNIYDVIYAIYQAGYRK